MSSRVVSDDLFSLLQLLMKDPKLDSFYLAGGTALALLLKHRMSSDIDLFNSVDFDSYLLATHFEKVYNASRIAWETNTLRVFINGIKVELISHQYLLLKELEIVEGIRVASLKDLAAFKLNAISGRESKKDFWDLDTLLSYYSLTEMIGFFQAKYEVYDLWNLIKSLSYFDDADDEHIELIDLQGKSWPTIKDNIIKKMDDSGLLA